MKPIQSLLAWLTYELSVGLLVRDFTPLSSGALEERLQRTNLPPSRIAGACRQALRHSLRVLAIAFNGLDEMPGMDGERATAFEQAFKSCGLEGDMIQLEEQRSRASKDCKRVLDKLDSIFALDTLDEEMVLQTFSFSEALLNFRALRMQAQLGSFFIKEALRDQVNEDSPLLAAPDAYGYLEGGILYFFAREVERIPEVEHLLEQMEACTEARIAQRLQEPRESQLLDQGDDDAARQVLAEHLPQRIAVARQVAEDRAAYRIKMAPILANLDAFYVALELKRPYTGRFTREQIEQARKQQSDQYVMPLEQSDKPAPPEQQQAHNADHVFTRANEYFAGADYDKAIRLYNHAIDLDPRMGKAHFNLSQAYIRIGQLSNALNAYNEALQHDKSLRIVPEEFEVEAILGAGGMGLLFRVREIKKDRICTLRVLNPQLTANQQRMPIFIKLLKRLRKIQSSALIPVYDLRKFREHYLLTTEYVKGWSLRQVIDNEGALSQTRAAKVFQELCKHLLAAHAGDVVHLNLKPSCIFLEPNDQIRIGDFSLMCLLEPGGSLEASGMPMEYLAPEQSARADADEPADIYALSMILFEMLTGERWTAQTDLFNHNQIDPSLLGLIEQGTRQDPDARCPLRACRKVTKELLTDDDSAALLTTISLDQESQVAQVAGGKVSIPQGMTLVPAGPFTMGQDGEANAAPARIVELDDFLIDLYPITNQQYREFLISTDHRPPFVNAPWTKHYNWKRDKFPPGTDDHPVVLISWYDAVAYAQWAEKRLPTEAEWEKAARGTDLRRYPWGDEISQSRSNYGSKDGKVQSVGQYPDNLGPFGCVGMCGNVWEWVADWYEKDYYTKAPAGNPAGPKSGKAKVLRGGAFDSVEEAVLNYFRFRQAPHTQAAFVGFRLARDI